MPIANRVDAGKRPRSSMAPTLVFAQGQRQRTRRVRRWPPARRAAPPSSSTSPRRWWALLDWGLDAQQATSLVDFGAANSATTNVGGEHPNVNIANNGNDDPLVSGLRALRHTVSINAQSSGVSTIMRARVNGSDVWRVVPTRGARAWRWATRSRPDPSFEGRAANAARQVRRSVPFLRARRARAPTVKGMHAGHRAPAAYVVRRIRRRAALFHNGPHPPD